jgi:hypothetical protein
MQLSIEEKEGIMMKRSLVMMIIGVFLFVATFAFAGAPKTYQVTGPVLELKDDMIVVQKGNDRWEIARGADTKVTGELKVGSKVTIEYRMSAATIAVKDEGKKKGK